MYIRFGLGNTIFTGAIILIAAAGCMEHGTAPEAALPESYGEVRTSLAAYNRSRLLRTAAGEERHGAAMQPGLTRLTRLVAIALANPALRALVYREMQGSPYAEHKLHLRSFLDGNGETVAKWIREASGRSREGLLASLDSLMDLEVYMPVKDHYAQWTGGSDVIVASLLQDGDAPVAFDLKGRPVPVRADTPPETPTLVLVKSETDFTQARAPEFQKACPPEQSCGGGGGGGGGGGPPPPPPPPPPPTPGIRMLSVTLVDDGEDNFFRGDPEIEVMFMGRRSSGHTNLAALPANEGPNSPAERRFDMNSHSYSVPSGSRGILIVSKSELDALFGRFPGTNLDRVPFTIAVWEDDTDRGKIVDEDNWWSLGLHTVQTVTFGLLGATDVQSSPCPPNEGGSCKPGGPLTVLGLVGAAISFSRLLTDVGSILTGDNDEFLGIAVGANALYNATGTTTAKTHALMQGNKKMGEITLQYVQ